ncbi:small oligopeptide transporter [Metschnikowia bicuspidata var. bicuspidata NRRL YB-4993]|uniref:Small oligopeptide transporter n=1 Tax=Metschnikowia bicuspidata var. bicuspidata NRRL YB-4993 TaxID=869754 RepID=A0A1A0HII4_9ASCO|nr:small oligopeptide transporter [Metschnikowia bicuspidata var. bicuspidata NRRL YB-4993]OBA23811.1 small oligopeptide transporter [Metschnikowia bicuspidata var. bicuspidata NRRL YB-4993]
MEKLKSIISHERTYHEEKRVSSDGDEINEEGLTVVKSAEFDPVTSALEEKLVHDEYAGIHIEDDSPYPEVRASVPSTDDPSLVQNTIRVWIIGFIMTTLGCGMNTLFAFHSPSFSITTYVTSILAYPAGRLWEKTVPNWKIFGCPLNPGPFNLKEHAIITIMGSVSFGGGAAYATDILTAQNKFYNSDFGVGFAICAILSTQVIGFSLAGLSRKVLVDSPGAIWPANLVTTTFLTNMHLNENHPANGWKISRFAFFSIVFSAYFFWNFLPNYMFTALSYFAWPTWIAPNNVPLNQVFGASTGLGLMPITFDWNQIAGYIGSPLIPPAGTIITIFSSIVLIFWIVVPAVYYTNTWYSKYLPLSSSGSYDRYQNTYNVSKIIDTTTLTFDEASYKAYSPLFISSTFAISYGLSFASIIATLVHTVCFHGTEIVQQFKQKEKPDVHLRLMRANYKNIPEWWYGIVFLMSFAISIVTIRYWNTEMPVWSLIVALLIALLFLLPVGIIYAKTNIAVGLNVLTEFIIGYMVPGKPLAMMFFKTFGYITNNQAVTFAQDMKLGHYLKIDPRLLFWAQLFATIWGSLVQIGVMRWAYGAIDGLCDSDQKNNYTCPNGRVFFNASLIWGAIGPERTFGPGSIYHGALFFFLLGLLPFFNCLILRKWPNSKIRWLNWPVFFSGTGYIPPATPYNYATYCMSKTTPCLPEAEEKLIKPTVK